MGIKLLVSVIPGILYMSCAVFMFFYTIDAKTTDLMKRDLDARRESQGTLMGERDHHQHGIAIIPGQKPAPRQPR